MNFILQKCQKQTTPLESTAQWFHPQTQKVQLHLLTQGLTLGVKGLQSSSSQSLARDVFYEL